MGTTKDRIRIGVVADDFTGASDAASYLKKGGMRTKLVIDPWMEEADRDECDAIVIALKSRSIRPDAAVSQMRRAAGWLREAGAKKLYFKYCSTFDSTPEGNIGPVSDALLEMTGEPFTFLCPSLPDNGRRVRDGILYVNDVPLALSHMKDHPLNPMWASGIPELMKPQSKYPVHVLAREVLADAQQLSRFISGLKKKDDHFYLVPDYMDEDDGKLIAERFRDLSLGTGGSGLLMHMARLAREGEDLKASSSAEGEALSEAQMTGRPESCEIGRLMLCGSCSAMTRRQTGRYLASGGRSAMVGPEDCGRAQETIDRLAGMFLACPEKDMLICCSGSVDGYEAVKADPDIARQLEQILAGAARQIMGEHPVERLIAAGGETSGAVTQALGFHVFSVGDSVAPGVPVLYPQGTSVRLVLKSGNFGGEDFFLTTLA